MITIMVPSPHQAINITILHYSFMSATTFTIRNRDQTAFTKGALSMSPLLKIIAIFAIIYPSLALSQTNTASPLSTGIIVTGECLTKVIQDRGSVVLGSTVVSKSTKEASDKVIKAHEILKDAVKDLRLKDFIAETAEYVVDQECSYDQGKRTCSGYRARLATRFETSEIGRLGEIIGVSSKLGSEEVSDLRTFAAPQTLKTSREACLETAMKNAASKARILAQGAGVTLGKLVLVNEGRDTNDHRPIPMPMAKRGFEAAAMSDAAGGPSVDARPIDLRVEITAQYAIQ
jgi:uncharacterized protein YggE